MGPLLCRHGGGQCEGLQVFVIQTLAAILRERRVDSAMACRCSTPPKEHSPEENPAMITAGKHGAGGQHQSARASPHPRTPQCPAIHIPWCMQKRPSCLASTGYPQQEPKLECRSDSQCRAQSLPYILFLLQILSTHLPTGNSQFLHEGLDAHSLVIPNQFGERRVSAVFPQDHIPCIGLHLDHVVSAAAFAPGEMDRQKQSWHGATTSL